MKNRYKFRAWDNEENKYFEPIYEAYKGNLLDLSIGLGGDIIRRTMKYSAEHESLFEGKYTLEQWTGLTDKNGTEIYEGDILVTDWGDTDWGDKCIGVCCYDEPCAYYKFKCDSRNFSYDFTETQADEYEVIGNIHQNKDLL